MFIRSALVSALLMGATTAFVPQNNVNLKQQTVLNLAVGETAPDFALKDQNGKVVKRSSFKKPLVVYFYPADSTPGCTKQAQSFNDEVKEIRNKFGADVVGISGQDAVSKQKFAQELGLNFSILADEDNAVRKAFNVPKAAFGLLPGRVTYVLDNKGVCTKVHDDLADAASHVKVAKDALEEMGVSSNPLTSLLGR